MLNPTLSDLIGGIQIGDPLRRGGAPAWHAEDRPRAQGAADLRRHGRDPGPRAGEVHHDVAETIDAMLRGDPVAPELRWRNERRRAIAPKADRGRRPQGATG